MRALLVLPLLLCSAALQAQGYTNWFIGDSTDAQTQPLGGVCLMGGATEHDEAMRWFLLQADGGDVLVLRASGSSGYQNYLYSELGVAVNSVETIRFDDASAAGSAYVQERIQRAEAIWFAGGDQWNYVSYWRDTPIAALINAAITERNVVVGGTSAGMAILGGVYFTAQNGTVSSAAALADPYANAVTLSNTPFLTAPWMADVVTDTHYDNPDRRGRHTVFVARAWMDLGVDVLGIACNEYTAVCIAPDGIARVYGEWPQYPEYAFFVQPNCEEPEGPELLAPGQPLTWHRSGQAVKVYKVPGTMFGEHFFDLNDRRSGSGGSWEDWSVQAGVFATQQGGPAPACATGLAEHAGDGAYVATDLELGEHRLVGLAEIRAWRVTDALGRELPATVERTHDGLRIAAAPGLRLLHVEAAAGSRTFKLMMPR